MEASPEREGETNEDSRGREDQVSRDRNITGVAVSAFVTVVVAAVRLGVAVCDTSGVAEFDSLTHGRPFSRSVPGRVCNTDLETLSTATDISTCQRSTPANSAKVGLQ